MLVYHQKWVKNPTRENAMNPGILWNMWKNQMPPYADLKNGEIVLMVGPGGPKKGIIMYEGKVRYIVKGLYSSHEEAWNMLANSIPLKVRANELTRKMFLEAEYTKNAADHGWLMAWYDFPVKWIGSPRPPELRFRQNGWSEINDLSVPGNSRVRKSDEVLDDLHEREILQRSNIGPLEKQNLVKSRRGQGIFKSNVRLFESQCRVTATTAKQHLIASHIKPWRESNDKQKIDGQNGFLLAPHIDHLFDAGYISFRDDGSLLVSPKLGKNLLKSWGISESKNVGTFLPKQLKYLEYHRTHVFKG